jgi:hypothetical protein
VSTGRYISFTDVDFCIYNLENMKDLGSVAADWCHSFLESPSSYNNSVRNVGHMNSVDSHDMNRYLVE